MIYVISIRKPHDKILDEVLRTGRVEVSTGVGLYYSRLRKDLEDVVTIKPATHDVFEISRGRDVVKKIGETFKHSNYRRTRQKWKDLL